MSSNSSVCRWFLSGFFCEHHPPPLAFAVLPDVPLGALFIDESEDIKEEEEEEEDSKLLALKFSSCVYI